VVNTFTHNAYTAVAMHVIFGMQIVNTTTHNGIKQIVYCLETDPIYSYT
jgi:hypothetical protein